MSLDVYLTINDGTVELFNNNITHNLNNMAEAAGIYKCLWRPEEIGIKKASQLIEPLEKGLIDMKARPEYYKEFNAKNGFGLYNNFVSWIEEYLEAAKQHPEADVSVWR